VKDSPSLMVSVKLMGCWIGLLKNLVIASLMGFVKLMVRLTQMRMVIAKLKVIVMRLEIVMVRRFLKDWLRSHKNQR
jgi:hypothetical protein